MNKSKLIASALTAWIVIEVVAFVLVVQFLGLLAAIALGVGTTLIGLADIKRLFVYLGARLKNPLKRPKPSVRLLEGSLEAFASLLLILPGFASDLVGLALKSPSIRAQVAERLRKAKKRRAQTIDLAPSEWKSLNHLSGGGENDAV